MIDARVFRLVSYGLYVVASFRSAAESAGPAKNTLGGDERNPDPYKDAGAGKAQGRLNGQIANTVFQLTADPPLLGVSLNCQNFTHELISESGRFSVSVLSQETPLKFIGLFGFKCGRQVDKFSGINYKVLESGTPVILDHCLGFFDLAVKQSIALGTHTLFIGQVTAAEVLADGVPLTYAYYHEIKGGRTQANAPTYIKDNEK